VLIDDRGPLPATPPSLGAPSVLRRGERWWTLAALVSLIGCGNSHGPTVDGGPDPDGGPDLDGGQEAADAAPADDAMAHVPRLTVHVLPEAAAQAWMAYRAVDGPWIPVIGAGPDYPLPITSGPYEVVAVCPPTANLAVTAATVEELEDVWVVCSDVSEIYTVKGSISGFTGTGVGVNLSDSRDAAVFAQSSGTSYQARAERGIYDIFAVQWDLQDVAQHALVRRDVEVVADVVADLDLSANGVRLVRQPVTVTGASPDDQMFVQCGFAAGRGATQLCGGELAVEPDTQYTAVAAEDLRPGEYNLVSVSSSSWGVHREMVESVPFVATPPPKLDPAVALETGAAPVSRPQVDLPQFPNVRDYELKIDRPNGPGVGWSVRVTPGWLGSQRRYLFPVLDDAPGFDPLWRLMQQSLPAEIFIIATSSNWPLQRSERANHAQESPAGRESISAFTRARLTAPP
jgi:hypothetical protein